jgi:hypothetical protein
MHTRWRGALPAHANLLEHTDSARYHFASFENMLLNVDGAAQDVHQCVWNAVDICDNNMNPAGVTFSFFPPARTYTFCISEYCSKFCHHWTRDPRLEYPLLPLQNTVSFVSAFPRRVLLNASARVLHYAYSGVGFADVAHLSTFPRPARSAHFASDLYLSLDLHRMPNASVVVLVPDDRGLADAAWIPSLCFAVLAADNTARATLTRLPLRLEAVLVSRAPPSGLRIGLALDAAVTPVELAVFAGVHCEAALSRFAVPANHSGAAWVSRNNVLFPAPNTSQLASEFPEMALASPEPLVVALSHATLPHFPQPLPVRHSSPGSRLSRGSQPSRTTRDAPCSTWSTTRRSCASASWRRLASRAARLTLAQRAWSPSRACSMWPCAALTG